MERIDMAELAEMSTVGLRAAKVRVALEKMRVGLAFEASDKSTLHRAAKHLKAAVSSWEKVIDQRSYGAHTLIQLRDLQTLSGAINRESTPPMSQEAREYLLLVSDKCKALSREPKAPAEDLELLEGFFKALSALSSRKHERLLSCDTQEELP